MYPGSPCNRLRSKARVLRSSRKEETAGLVWIASGTSPQRTRLRPEEAATSAVPGSLWHWASLPRQNAKIRFDCSIPEISGGIEPLEELKGRQELTWLIPYSTDRRNVRSVAIFSRDSTNLEQRVFTQ